MSTEAQSPTQLERPKSGQSQRSVRSNVSRYSHMSAEEITADYLSRRSGSAAASLHGSVNHQLEGAAAEFDMRMEQASDPRAKKASTFKVPPIMPRSFVNRKYTPGPGSYELYSSALSTLPDRKGATATTKYTFGSGERSFIKHEQAQSFSPGPVYLTNKPPIFARPGFSFGTGSRFCKPPSNSEVYAPGPGQYCGNKVKSRKGTEFLDGTRSATFGESAKGSIVSYKEVMHDVENLGLSSPGPKYNSRVTSTETFKWSKTGDYTIGKKVPGEVDEMLRLKVGPGPGVYKPEVCRNGRGKLCRDAPALSFPRAHQRPRSDLQYLTATHTEITNKGIHSPGPVYNVQLPPRHYPKCDLRAQGSADRFFDPFEPGRLHEGLKPHHPHGLTRSCDCRRHQQHVVGRLVVGWCKPVYWPDAVAVVGAHRCWCR